jgi:hypothetical protein
MIQTAAIAYAGLVALTIVFQFCLIAGAPWGRWTQGGRHDGPLPVTGRIGAGVSVLVLVFLASAIASAAGMPPHWPGWTAWVALGIQAASTLLNWITRSRVERLVWGPVTTVMLSLSLSVVIARYTAGGILPSAS